MNLGLKSSKRRQMAEINVVPYIDVMLVLLVIFMITTPLLNQGVKVNLPKTNSDAIAAKDREPLVVTINAEGEYFLNIAPKPAQPLAVEAIQGLVTQTLQQDQQKGVTRPVLVKADQSINYGVVVTMMARLQKAGAETVGLVTDAPAIVQNSTVRASNYNASTWRAANA